jgi:hypothetical protein
MWGLHHDMGGYVCRCMICLSVLYCIFTGAFSIDEYIDRSNNTITIT